MAGRSIEKMAQAKFNELVELENSLRSDIVKADKEVDRIMDLPYYPTQDRDVEGCQDIINDAEQQLNHVQDEINQLLDDFGYCIDVDEYRGDDTLYEDANDDFDDVDEEGIITEEEEEFASSIYNLLQELIRQDDNYNIVASEDFSSDKSLNSHFKKHCLGKDINKLSSRQTVFYDFKDNSGYMTLEKELRSGIGSVSNDNKKVIIDSLYKTDDVIKGFHKLFEGGDTYLIFTPLCGFFAGESRSVTYCLRAFANKNTTNYTKGNTIDFMVIEGKNTNTLFPVDANYLENKFNSCIKNRNNKFKGKFIINRSDRI